MLSCDLAEFGHVILPRLSSKSSTPLTYTLFSMDCATQSVLICPAWETMSSPIMIRWGK